MLPAAGTAVNATRLGAINSERGCRPVVQSASMLRPGTIIAIAVLMVALFVAGVVALVGFVAAHRLPPRTEQPLARARIAPPAKAHGPVLVRDSMEERARACTACHGSETQVTRDGFSPRLAGKPAGYLLNQLASFRDGRRTYPPMVYLVQYMT